MDTFEDRVDRLVAVLEERADRHDEMIGRLVVMSEKLVEMDRQLMVAIARTDEKLEEIRKDTRQTQRLWVKLAQKHGWLDDEDLMA